MIQISKMFRYKSICVTKLQVFAVFLYSSNAGDDSDNEKGGYTTSNGELLVVTQA